MSLSTNKRLNNVRDFLVNDEPDLAVGTGTEQIAGSSTSLQNEVIRKAASLSSGGTGLLKSQITLLSTEANNEELAEVGTVDTDGDVTSHITFASELKTSDKEFIFEVTTEVVNT